MRERESGQRRRERRLWVDVSGRCLEAVGAGDAAGILVELNAGAEWSRGCRGGNEEHLKGTKCFLGALSTQEETVWTLEGQAARCRGVT